MISKSEVEHIAELAHLKLSDEDKGLFTKQLSDILTYVEKLKGLDTDKVVPTAYTVSMKNVLREDKLGRSLPCKKALANAPDQKDDQFRVPKIIS